MEEVCYSCAEWQRKEGNGEPGRFILNLSLDDDDVVLLFPTLLDIYPGLILF